MPSKYAPKRQAIGTVAGYALGSIVEVDGLGLLRLMGHAPAGGYWFRHVDRGTGELSRRGPYWVAGTTRVVDVALQASAEAAGGAGDEDPLR